MYTITFHWLVLKLYILEKQPPGVGISSRYFHHFPASIMHVCSVFFSSENQEKDFVAFYKYLLLSFNLKIQKENINKMFTLLWSCENFCWENMNRHTFRYLRPQQNLTLVHIKNIYLCNSISTISFHSCKATDLLPKWKAERIFMNNTCLFSWGCFPIKKRI